MWFGGGFRWFLGGFGRSMDRSEGRGFIVKGSSRAFEKVYVKRKNFVDDFGPGRIFN